MPKADGGSQRHPGQRILLVGTGGQGVITAARLLAEFFVRRGRQVVSSQLHGMAQRGGAVQSSVMIDCGISPAMPRGGADVVVGLEPVETARALPFISSRTVVLMNTAAVVPYILSQQHVLGSGAVRYPDIGELAESIRAKARSLSVVDATALAKGAGSVRTLNVVMLGCLFGSGLIAATPQEFIEALMRSAPPKLAEPNRKAFLAGVELGGSRPCLKEAQ